MFLKSRLPAFAAVTAALALGVPAVSANAAPAADPVITGPSCPDGYSGPTNLATGCPFWMMSYKVEYPGEMAFNCPVTWNGVGGTTGPGIVDPRCSAVTMAE